MLRWTSTVIDRLGVRLGACLLRSGFVALTVVCVALSASAAVVPPFFLDSVAVLGGVLVVPETVGESPRPQWRTTGSGFFYGYLVEDNPEPSKRRYAIFLVTARHVVAGFLAANREVNVRLNPKASGVEGRQFAIPNRPDPGSSTWFCHPDRQIDVALVPMNFDFLKEQGIEPMTGTPRVAKNSGALECQPVTVSLCWDSQWGFPGRNVTT